MAPPPATIRRLRPSATVSILVFALWLTADPAQVGAVGPEGFRALAPGVLTVIPTDIAADDTLQRGDIPEITRGLAEREWTPKRDSVVRTLVERGRNRTYNRDIWCLSFAFKVPRHIDVDVPGADLKMRRKRLLYLLYQVKNVGGRRTVPEADDPLKLKRETFETPIRFLPHFVLESIEGLEAVEGSISYRGYLDRVVPAALEPIRRREGVTGRLYDSASMVETQIAPGESRWGVAIWEDIDPRIDYFSIFVRGLTNAIRWRVATDAAIAADAAPGIGTDHALESLRLDFWHPSDEADVSEHEMQIGHAGLLERMAIGVRLLEAFGRPRLTKADALDGLEQLGLSWRDLLEPAVAPGAIDRDAAHSLAPLEKVVTRLAAIKEPTARGVVVRDLFGDAGIQWFEDLSRGLAAPVSADREPVRRAALEGIGIAPDDLAQKPLESLAKVLHALDGVSGVAARRAQAEALFGPAADRLDALVKDLSLARTLAIVHEIEIDRKRLAAAGPRGAFDALREVVDAEPDAGRRTRMLQGLFGPEGPPLYAAATALNEGIDHAWVFRYEIDEQITD